MVYFYLRSYANSGGDKKETLKKAYACTSEYIKNQVDDQGVEKMDSFTGARTLMRDIFNQKVSAEIKLPLDKFDDEIMKEIQGNRVGVFSWSKGLGFFLGGGAL